MRRPLKQARYRLRSHPAITADLASLATYGCDIVAAVRSTPDDLVHGRELPEAAIDPPSTRTTTRSFSSRVPASARRQPTYGSPGPAASSTTTCQGPGLLRIQLRAKLRQRDALASLVRGPRSLRVVLLLSGLQLVVQRG